MGAINSKTDFQSVLVVSCLMFDLEHIIRVIVRLIGRQQRQQRERLLREIGCQTNAPFAQNLPDIAIITNTNSHIQKIENVSFLIVS